MAWRFLKKLNIDMVGHGGDESVIPALGRQFQSCLGYIVRL
jgi:hypothetical protein